MVDLTFLKTFTRDDPKKMKRYISLYLDVAPKTFEEMQRNLKDGEPALKPTAWRHSSIKKMKKTT